MNHLLLTCESQLSGHIISSDKHLTMSFENSLLHTTLDIESMRLVLLYCCEIIEAKPQTCSMEPGTFRKGSEPLHCAMQLRIESWQMGTG